MIRFGHSWEAIQEYTFDQIKLFLESAVFLELEERRQRILEMAIGAQGDEKTIRKAIRDLDDG